jgi:multisubunit Na+/H+ antiporter MnhC subunit
MTLDTIYGLAEILLLYGAAVSVLFVVCYAAVARKAIWRHLTTAAIFISSTAVALLLNLEIALAAIQASEYVDAVVTLAVLTAICAGATFKLLALGHEWRRGRQHSRFTPPN